MDESWREESSSEVSDDVIGDNTLEAYKVFGDEVFNDKSGEVAEMADSGLKEESPSEVSDEEIIDAESELKREDDTDEEAEAYITISQLRSSSIIQVPITLEDR